MATNEEIFFKAAFIEPPRICGRRLLPFSIAHDYLLRYYKSPYIVGGSVDDDCLLDAIYYCSLTYRELRRHIANPSWVKAGAWRLCWLYRNLNFAHDQFLSYFEEYYEVPDHFDHVEDELPAEIGESIPAESKSKKGTYAAPWHYHLAHILRSQYHCTKDEAWNTSITEARCVYDVWAESTGDDSLVPVHVGNPLQGDK